MLRWFGRYHKMARLWQLVLEIILQLNWSDPHSYVRCCKRFLAAVVMLPIVLALVACNHDQKPQWNVLLVTFDTTRADFIGSYGKESANTPTLDGMAASGTLFEQAMSSNPVTQPSHSTILTGTYPMTHGVRDNGLFKLPEASETLAEILAANGYRTGAAIGGFPLVKSFGLDQGFEFYDDQLTAVRQDHRGRPARRSRATWYDERPAGHVNDAILPWLREPNDKPFFTWIHYWDPHHPHIAPPPYGQQFAHDPFQGEIAYADQSLGVILDDLEFRGELERTIIVMTSDHGESRGQHHEETHAFLAYNPTLHVPLIMQVPGGPKGKRVLERVGTVDIVPTILDLLGIETPEAIQGRSLVGLINQPAEDQPRNRRRYYSESMSPRFSHGFGELRALYWGPYKLIHGPRSELFDLTADPGELHDLIESKTQVQEEMHAGLVDFVDQHASPVAVGATHDFDDSVRRRLAALGYLSTSDDSDSTVAETLRTDGIPPQDRVTVVNLQQRLRQLLGTGQYLQAERILLELLEPYPDHAFYQAKLALVYLGLNRVDQAAALVDATLDIDSAHAADYLDVAAALFEDGERDRGLAMAKRIAQSVPTANVFLVLAKIQAESGDNAAVLGAIENALELEPEHLGARLELAQLHIEGSRLGAAEELLVKLLSEHPVHPEANLRYAQLLMAKGQPGQAVSRLDRMLILWPGSCGIHLQRFEMLIDHGLSPRIESAHEELKEHCRDQKTLTRATDLMKKNNAT